MNEDKYAILKESMMNHIMSIPFDDRPKLIRDVMVSYHLRNSHPIKGELIEMNELKTKLEEEDKDFLVATILDLQNMIDHQRKQILIKDRSMKRFIDSNSIYEDTLNRVREAIIDLIRDITLGNITTVPEFVNHLERLKDAI